MYAIHYKELVKKEEGINNNMAKKRDKKIRAMLEAVKVGDKIRTIGGIYGKIVSINDDRVIIETAEGTQIEFAKGAISTVESADVEADMGDMKK